MSQPYPSPRDRDGVYPEMEKDHVYAASPLLEDALRSIASVVKHIAMGVVGLGSHYALNSQTYAID